MFRLKFPVVWWLVLGGALLCGPSVLGKEIMLVDGTSIEDEVLEIGGGKIRLEKHGEMPLAKVVRIEWADRKEGGPAAGKLAEKPGEPAGEWPLLKKDAEEFGKEYPDAGALLLRDFSSVELRPDGTFRSVVRVAYLILKDDRLSLAKAQLWFVKGRSRTRLLYGRALHPDGTVTAVDPATLKEEVPASEGAELSNDMIIPFVIPGVVTGSIIDYSYEDEEYNPFTEDTFTASFWFQGTDPYGWSKLEITCPAEVKLNVKLGNFEGKVLRAEETVAEGKRHYLWETRKQPPVVEEPYSVPMEDILPCVQVRRLSDWEKIFKYYKELYDTRTEPGEELKKFTLDLTKEEKTPEEKMAKIYHYLQSEIRYVIVKLGHGNVPPYAEETWKKGFGCCIDKAVLFTAMLKAVGVTSYVAKLMTLGSHKLDLSLPTYWPANHAITMVELDGRRLYLDSTNNDFRYPSVPLMDYGVPCVIPQRGVGDFIPLNDPAKDGYDYDHQLVLAADGSLEGRMVRRFYGNIEAVMRGAYKRRKPEDRLRALRGLVSTWGEGAALVKADFVNLQEIDRPFSIDLAFKLGKFPEKTGSLVIMNFPGLPDYLSKFPELGLPERKFDLLLDGLTSVRKHYELKVPAGYRVKYLPPSLHLATPWFVFNGSYRWEEGKLDLAVEFKRLALAVPTSKYREYRQELFRGEKFVEEKFFFEAAEVAK